MQKTGGKGHFVPCLGSEVCGPQAGSGEALESRRVWVAPCLNLSYGGEFLLFCVFSVG